MPPCVRRPLVEFESDSEDSVAPFDTSFPPRRNFTVERHFFDNYDSIDEPIPPLTRSAVIVQVLVRAKAKPTLTKAKQSRDMESSDSGVEHAPIYERTKAKARKSKTILISNDEI
ncbi:hypothetical protein MMC07_008815, partial [Pseudocyphellaria aurata]|nr:hypothetical protein [Pseudocyphellaria aurata]